MLFPLHCGLVVFAMHVTLMDKLYNTCACMYTKILNFHMKMYKLDQY